MKKLWAQPFDLTHRQSTTPDIPETNKFNSVKRYLPLFLSLVVAACSGSGERADDESIKARAIAEFSGLLSMQDQAVLDKERSQIVERAISVCMREQGFTYEPFRDAHLQSGSAHGLSSDFTSMEYAQKNGFGITANAVSPTNVQIPIDPNSRWLMEQAKDLQVAWSSALDGPTPDGRAPCREVGERAFDQEIGIDYTRLEDVHKQTLSSAEMLAAQQEWEQCATEVGFPAADRLALIDSFIRRMKEATGGAPMNEVTPDSLTSLRAEEISAAVATFPCSQRYDKVYEQVFKKHLAHD